MENTYKMLLQQDSSKNKIQILLYAKDWEKYRIDMKSADDLIQFQIVSMSEQATTRN